VILYPAIDLKEGACVRLVRGDMAAATVFNRDPTAQAQIFEQTGFRWLHVVDLDGAVAGRSMNQAAVAAILRAVKSAVQLGGGIRDRAAIDRWLDTGIARVILGTVALTDPALVREACRAYPGRILVGIDARQGRVATQGWVATSDTTALELARRFEDAGVSAVIYTDIERDGVRAGVNLEATAALARALKIPVIASGGVAGLEDIRALKRLEGDGIAGVICGRALYDGSLDAKAALALEAEVPAAC
jgi:phosphoribosylformimino-5-aminoimidazole carboxamide ribotide isomerase